ncbi:hypothetical protein GCM10012275_61260 [Longimycelium tulufanense]|uniref:PE domain-containing protein n=1 Tax=Longimycelium tulufanense TaxID=907463 RepID=A0A8J3CKZ7_9PSEU|nr:hypothetical protein [Longimycelium tulufanense]GGM82415.1 hypothetical protein GCM10012275_61260 [Longimycelium tulufanense]
MASDSSGLKLVVAPEKVEQLIEGLKGVIAELDDIHQQAQQLTQIEAPGSGDPHTQYAIREISRLASDDDGCHGQVNRQYKQTIQNVIDNLQASLNAYRQTEQQNTMRA